MVRSGAQPKVLQREAKCSASAAFAAQAAR
jgi:hypothetical protein